ncbi:MAG: cell wall-active antibiotics response protein [Parabacteroides sp.]|nr:cell wall-active antibiotics response protein [Parabacteroides sp.]
MHTKKNLFWAIPLIYVGLTWQAKNMGYITPQLFGVLVSWQTLFIYIGIWSTAARHFVPGLAAIAFGTVFLLPEIGIAEGEWSTFSWPLALIITGIIVLFKPLFRRHRMTQQPVRSAQKAYTDYACTDGFVELNNRFGAVRQLVFDPVFKGAVIKNSFGGVGLDLRRTALAEPVTYIDIECTFGGIEIYIPSEWNIQPQLHAVVGGCDDKRQSSPDQSDAVYTLVIRGNITFGGIEFKN